MPRFGDEAPSLDALHGALQELTAEIATHGEFNFLLSNGEALFAHCSTHLHYVTRQYPFTRAHLVDCELSIDFNDHNHLDDCITVIATKPLTSNENWVAFAPGELKMFQNGAAPEWSARGARIRGGLLKRQGWAERKRCPAQTTDVGHRLRSAPTYPYKTASTSVDRRRLFPPSRSGCRQGRAYASGGARAGAGIFPDAAHV